MVNKNLLKQSDGALNYFETENNIAKTADASKKVDVLIKNAEISRNYKDKYAQEKFVSTISFRAINLQLFSR